MKHMDGTIIAHDAQSGEILWEWNYDDHNNNSSIFTLNRQYSVKAEFELSSDGLMIYYGDIYGG